MNSIHEKEAASASLVSSESVYCTVQSLYCQFVMLKLLMAHTDFWFPVNTVNVQNYSYNILHRIAIGGAQRLSVPIPINAFIAILKQGGGSRSRDLQ